jgi:hypothetical protein
MSIRELELIKLMMEIDPSTTVREVIVLLKEIRKGNKDDKQTTND